MARVSATLTLLLATAASAQSTCTYDDSSCTYTCGAAKFSLSSIAVPAAGYFTATGGDTPYYFNLCAAITTITCDGAGPSPACIQNYGQAQPPALPTGSCASIGTYPAATSSSVGDGSNASLVLSYQGGDGGRSFDITLSCAPTLTPPTATDDGNLKYGIAFGAPAICAGASGGRTGLSYGSLTLILSGVAIFVYIAGGIFYNHRYREMPVVRAARPRVPARARLARAHPPGGGALRSQGLEAIPLWSYWKQLPGLVYDGCKFSYEQSKEAYEKWNNRHVEGAEVKQGLKAAEEEGAATATQYEAHTQEQAERLATEPPPAGGSASGSARNSAA